MCVAGTETEPIPPVRSIHFTGQLKRRYSRRARLQGSCTTFARQLWLSLAGPEGFEDKLLENVTLSFGNERFHFISGE